MLGDAEDLLHQNNKALEAGHEPKHDEPALCGKIARLREDMIEFAEEPRDLVILDENGAPLKAGDHARRFFEASWMHKYGGKYYYSYSTGDTHFLCYAMSDSLRSLKVVPLEYLPDGSIKTIEAER